MKSEAGRRRKYMANYALTHASKGSKPPKSQNFCDKCNKTFTRKYAYRLHMQKFHILPQSKDAENFSSCEKCQTTHINEKELVKHILARHAVSQWVRLLE